MTWWGPPTDPVAWLSLIVAAAWGAFAYFTPKSWQFPSWAFCALIVMSAWASSWGYVFIYLKGGPRIIDATTYLLQAKTLASGQWAFPVEGPLASFQGRFLIQDAAGRLSGIFPPGYPLALAPFVAAGAPMALGPVIAAAISVLTYFLTRRWFRSEAAARLAAVLSLLSITLRYHTADTMSHGWCALLWLASAYSASFPRRSTTVLAGLLIGWLTATRPVTGWLAGMFVALVIHHSSASGAPAGQRQGGSAARLKLFAAGVAPGLLFLLIQQHAVTGEWFTSSQYSYYARSDHPAECFRYGFGSKVGCQGEHGDFIETYMPNGYGWQEALATTGRRLSLHASDAGNSPLFAVLLLWCIWQGRKHVAVRWLAGACAAQVVAYVPFYFDGNYPSGGARLFADILPFQHAILGWGMTRTRIGRYAPALALAGFSVYGSHQHAWLATEQSGRPAFDSRLATPPAGSLVFVTGDHAFNLGHEPDPRRARYTVARLRGDAHDHALWRHLGSPASFVYRDAPGSATPLLPYIPEPSRRRQAEALWPVLEATRGTVLLAPLTGCAEGERGLRLYPESTEAPETPEAAGAITMELLLPLWVDKPGQYRIGVHATPSLRWKVAHQPLAMRATGACSSESAPVQLEAGNQPLLVTTPEASQMAFVSLEWLGTGDGSAASSTRDGAPARGHR